MHSWEVFVVIMPFLYWFADLEVPKLSLKTSLSKLCGDWSVWIMQSEAVNEELEILDRSASLGFDACEPQWTRNTNMECYVSWSTQWTWK